MHTSIVTRGNGVFISLQPNLNLHFNIKVLRIQHTELLLLFIWQKREKVTDSIPLNISVTVQEEGQTTVLTAKNTVKKKKGAFSEKSWRPHTATLQITDTLQNKAGLNRQTGYLHPASAGCGYVTCAHTQRHIPRVDEYGQQALGHDTLSPLCLQVQSQNLPDKLTQQQTIQVLLSYIYIYKKYNFNFLHCLSFRLKC